MSAMHLSRRSIILAASLAAMPFASAAGGNKAWNTDSGTWSDPSHWSPTGSPTAADTVLLGNTPAAHDSTAHLDVDTIIAGLSITDGMTLSARTEQITVVGNTTISGDNVPNGGLTSRLAMWHNLFNAYDFRTNNLSVLNGGDMFLRDTKFNVLGTMLVDGASSVYGRAEFNFYGNTGPVFTLDGDLTLGVYGNGPYYYKLNQHGAGRIDLDGGIAGDRSIDVAGYQSDFEVNGDQLFDAFDDSLAIGTGCRVAMNLSGGWTQGSTSWITFVQNGWEGYAHLTGGTLTSNGTIGFIGGGATAYIDAPLIINTGSMIIGGPNTVIAKQNVTVNTGRIDIYSQNKAIFDGPFTMHNGTIFLRGDYAAATFNNSATINGGTFIVNRLANVAFNGSTTINGGRMTLDEQAHVTFKNATTINGGTFSVDSTGKLDFQGNTKVFGGTFNGDPTLGGIDFNGTTEFRNTVNMSGLVRQNGPAKVDLAATINADRFDMDGTSALTKWTINAPLTINANKINSANNTFTGELTLTSTTSSPARLAVNLPAGQSWTSSGTLNIIGSGFGTGTNVISGSDVNLGGRVNISFENAMSAKANFTAFNVTTLNTASSLRLDGGTLLAPNTITGASINGPGTLKSSTNHALAGFGTINAAVAFAGGDLRAENGSLNLNGPISSVGIISAQPGGTLKFASQFNTSVATRLSLNGGTVTGASILNNKETGGFGAITAAGFVNNGSLNASNGTLLLNTTASPDLDGTIEGGDVLIAGGQLHVVDPLTDDFNGLAGIGAAGVLRLEQGWTLGAGGILALQGSQANPAIVIALSQTIAGMITMPSNTSGKFDAKTTFATTASTTINPNAKLELLQDGTIAQGATFVGSGTLRNAAGAMLLLNHGSEIGTTLENAGTLQFGAFFSAKAKAESFSQTATGLMQMDIFGSVPGTGFDQLDVTNAAAVDGAVTLINGFYNPAYGVSHEMLRAGSVTGRFAQVNGVAMSPTKYWAVTYDADSVNATAALPGDANLDGKVDIGDFAILASNFNGTGTWIDGSFDGNLLIDIGDFSLLGTNFNMSIPADIPRGSAVPEPAGGMVIIGLAAIGTRRCRCT